MSTLSILTSLVALVIVGYLPGALAYRLPLADRAARAALPAEERAFWHVVISLSWSLVIVMALAAAGVYTFERLLAANVIASAAMALVARGGLRYQGSVARLTATALFPVLLLGVSAWRFFPATEYVIGGKDPGVYVNEGVQIDRTGTLFRRDAIVRTVPADARELFFRNHGNELYYGLRFMGVFLNDPATGEVVAGWPHLYPASVAIGYRLAGIPGATGMISAWATLGLMAVYFFGGRLIGRGPAFVACIVLALNVVEVWYGRYPNTEIVMQALLFPALLALARAHQDGDGFFGWVAGGVSALMLFLRFDAFMAVAGMIGALALLWVIRGTRPRWGFVLPVVAGAALALFYYAGPLRAYFYIYRANLPSIGVMVGVAIALAALVLLAGRWRAWIATPIERTLPLALGGAFIVLAAYAMFLREPGGLLTAWDAYSVRTFRDAYVFWAALVAGVAGYVMLARRAFWRDPAFFAIFTFFCVFFFYKIRIVPDQFWMARRFVPIILPGVILLATTAVFGPSTKEHRRTVRRALASVIFLGFVGWQFAKAAAPVAAHREYDGAIALVQQLAAQFTPRDLVIVESRNSGSDYHVLAVPLAYQHGLNVLVLESPRPDRRQFEAFLADAVGRYERVLFVGGGGTDLLSRRVSATPVAFTHAEVPEYETIRCCSTADDPVQFWNRYPQSVRRKDLGYSVFKLELGGSGTQGFALDVGYLDDLNVLRFHAREVVLGRSIRWTMPQSFVAITGMTGEEREVELVMHAGGRPASGPPATVEVLFGDVSLGRVVVTEGFNSYRFALPADLVRMAAASPDPAQIILRTNTWSPHDVNGQGDTRQLGVMVDRVEIH
jgi:hypothetical protein